MSDLDEALERFHTGAFEYAGGLSNHGPMVAESLVRLGHASLIPGFVDVYVPRLGAACASGLPILPVDQPAALGRRERLGDWLATFEAQLEDECWPTVVGRVVPSLIDGLFAAGSHGLLRTAHAVRALEQIENPVRRRELAHGLAYWAGTYQMLPGSPGSKGSKGWSPERVLSEVIPVDPERRRAGFFTDGVGVLDDDPNFLRLIAKIDSTTLGWEACLSELCVNSAALYLANPQARVAYAHAVTAPSALRLIAPYLNSEQKRQFLGRAVQISAALHAISSTSENAVVDEEVKRVAGDVGEIPYRAACSLEEHAIKFAEDCLREDHESPSPIFRLAAADAALHLGT